MSALLVVVAGGYGYDRDELYFLEAGRHLAWGYADQGSALMSGGTVMLTRLTAFELGAGRPAQLIAATCAAGRSGSTDLAKAPAPRMSSVQNQC